MNRFTKTLIACAALIFAEVTALDNIREPELAPIVSVQTAKKTEKKEAVDIYTKEEKELIALITMAEAESEDEDGQRYVIDVILNRVESKYFPDTVSGVIYQKNQFSCVTNGRADKCCVDEDILKLVEEEIDREKRLNKDIVFFRASRYSDWGVPAFKYGSHYFSTYE